MKEVIVSIEIVRLIAKDLHYTVRGESFYSNHEFMDRVQKELSDFVDEIKENYFMARDEVVPTNKAIYTEAIGRLKDSYSVQDLVEALKTALYAVEQASKCKDLYQGDTDLLGRISSNLLNSYGLAQRILK